MSKERKERLYYGWVVIFTCLFIGIISFGIRYSYGVFFKSLEQDFGWSRALTSGFFSVYMLLCCMFAMLGGWVLDRYGPKVVVVQMGVFTGLSLILTSFAGSLWQLFISYSFLLAVGTGPAYTMVMATASNWFARRRGLAVGIVGSGSGLGILIIAPIAARLISSYSWQTTYFIFGLLALFAITPGALLLRKPPPVIAELTGIKDLAKSNLTISSKPPLNEQEDYSLIRAARTKNFWLIFFVWVLYSLCLHIVLTHLVPHAIDTGISPLRAAAILTLLGGASVPGRTLMGRVSDSIGRKQAGIISALFMAGAMLLLMAGSSLWILYLFGIVFGLFYGAIDPPTIALVGDIFGVRHIGMIMGALVVGWSAGAAIGPALAGYIFDAGGSYAFAFLAGAAAMVIVAVLIFLMKRPEYKIVSSSGH